MAFQDPIALREKIINFLRIHGPSLPVHISKETGLSILFSSAFLSELMAEKEVKMSDLHVGSSPVYFLPGQEHLLEKFSHHLKSKEKEAFMILKEKRFLKDSELSSPIRVAIRGIRDYAIPIQGKEEIIWKYFTVKDEEFKEETKKEIEIIDVKIEEPKELEEVETIEENSNEKSEEEIREDDTKEEEIIEEPKEKNIPKEKSKRKEKKKILKKKNDRFFDKVKEFISKKSLDILDIESFDANELALRVKDEEREFLIVAFNRKRLTEQDVLNAYKKASEKGLKYWILIFGEPVKKLENLINASRELERIERIG